MAVIYVFANDGSCLEKRGGSLTPGLTKAYQAKFGQDIYLTQWPEDPYPDLNNPDELSAEIAEGEVTDIIGPEPAPLVYCHLDFPGAVAGKPPRIAADGQEAVTANVALRAGRDPASALIPLSYTWDIEVYRGRTANGTDFINVPMEVVGGQGSAQFTTETPTDWEIREDTFDLVPNPLDGYKLSRVVLVTQDQGPKTRPGTARIVAYKPEPASA